MLVVEQRLGQRLGQLGLADAGGAQEKERADGPFRVADAGPAAQDGVADLGDGLVLADHTAVQDILQVQQLFPLALHQLGHRDAGPPRHDAGDLLLGYTVPQQAVLPVGGFALLFGLLQLLLQLGQPAVLQLGGTVQVVAVLRHLNLGVDLLDLLAQVLHLADGLLFTFPAGLHAVEGIPQLGQLLLHLSQMGLGQLVGLLLHGRFLDLQLHDAVPQLIQLGGHRVHLGLDEGAGLVHQVNGLIGQKTVGDIAVGKGGGGNQRRVLDLYAVVHLVALLQAAQDGNGILHRRLRHHHRLEPALQGGVLFDVLAVLVQGGGADAVQLAAGQQGL